jgi:DNA-binding response OmpR family regulator
MKPRILYVEDDRLVARAMLRLLEAEGFEVFPARSVLEAQAVIASGVVEAVLTDWNLAGETSEPIVAWGRAARVPTVVVSGSERVGILPWIEKTDTTGIREWLRSVRHELEQRAGAPS